MRPEYPDNHDPVQIIERMSEESPTFVFGSIAAVVLCIVALKLAEGIPSLRKRMEGIAKYALLNWVPIGVVLLLIVVVGRLVLIWREWISP
jgi:hypothetical protein